MTLKQIVFWLKVGNTYAVYAGCYAYGNVVKLRRQLFYKAAVHIP